MEIGNLQKDTPKGVRKGKAFMEKERLIDNYNSLVPTMNKLQQDGLDIWEEHDNMSGYGFKAIGEKKWIQVSIHHYFNEPNKFVVCCYERKGNYFDFISNKLLGRKDTQNYEQVYEIIKELF